MLMNGAYNWGFLMPVMTWLVKKVDDMSSSVIRKYALISMVAD